jgi:hypothetical protein
MIRQNLWARLMLPFLGVLDHQFLLDSIFSIAVRVSPISAESGMEHCTCDRLEWLNGLLG